jgi:putative heme degradation protein
MDSYYYPPLSRSPSVFQSEQLVDSQPKYQNLQARSSSSLHQYRIDINDVSQERLAMVDICQYVLIICMLQINRLTQALTRRIITLPRRHWRADVGPVSTITDADHAQADQYSCQPSMSCPTSASYALWNLCWIQYSRLVG